MVARPADTSPAALHKRLHEAVSALSSSDRWKSWLDVAARFHTYSANNTLMIWAQRPDATLVAGYRTWQRLGRQVNRGEHGIQILAPVMRTARTRSAAEEPEDSVADPPENVAAPRRVLVGVRPAYVWDISQTSGDSLPDKPRPQVLEGAAPSELRESLTDQVAAAGYELRRGASRSPSAYGSTDFVTRTVTVRTDLPDAQAVKTLAHELAHVLLHDPDQTGEPLPSCRGVAEVEAESVAYIIASMHGLDTSDYTFPYITGWAASVTSDNAVEVVTQTADRVVSTAHRVLADLGHQPEPLGSRPVDRAAPRVSSREMTRARPQQRRPCDLPAPRL